MSLKQRHIEILNLAFQNKNELDIKYISEYFEVSERSIRYDLKEVNEEFNNTYKSNILDIIDGKIKIHVSKKDFIDLVRGILPRNYMFTSEERVEILLFEILLFKEKFTLQNLSDELLISKTTLRKDIKDMNEKIKEFELKIEINNNQGYILSGSETNIRKLLISKLFQYGTFSKEIDHNSDDNLEIVKFLILDKKAKYLDEIDLDIYKNFLLELQEETKKIITDEAYEILLLYMLITSKRNKDGKYIEKSISNLNFIKGTDEYQVIKKISQNKKINCKEEDLVMFTDIFLGSYSYNTKFSFYLNWIKIETLVGKILENATKIFDVNLVNDQILIKELINHIKPAIYRIKNKISLKISILEDVKSEYLDLYQKTKKSLEVITEFLEEDIDDDEIAFITIIFKRAVNRNKDKIISEKRQNLLIVCGLGYSSSQFLAENIKDRFDVNIIDIIPFNQLENYKNIDIIDLIVSTIQINVGGVKVVKVNPILQKEDINKLEDYNLRKKSTKIPISKILKLIKENKEINNDKILIENIEKDLKEYVNNDISEVKSSNFLELLDMKNVALQLKLETWEELIEYSGNLLLKSDYIISDYIGEMKEQIKNYGGYILIGQNTILPHGKLNQSVKKTGFSLVSLKDPISFYGSEVKIAICLASMAKHEHINAILELNSYFRDIDFEKNLAKIETKEELSRFLNNRRNK